MLPDTSCLMNFTENILLKFSHNIYLNSPFSAVLAGDGLSYERFHRVFHLTVTLPVLYCTG